MGFTQGNVENVENDGGSCLQQGFMIREQKVEGRGHPALFASEGQGTEKVVNDDLSTKYLQNRK